MTASTAVPGIWTAISGLSPAPEQPINRAWVAELERGTFVWDREHVFTVTYSTPEGRVGKQWTAKQVARLGWYLRSKAERGEVWNIKVLGHAVTSPRHLSGPPLGAPVIDWMGAFECFEGWTCPTTGIQRKLRVIDLGVIDTDIETGEKLETFVLTYEQLQTDGYWALVKRTMPRRGIEDLGAVVARAAERTPQTLRNIAVHDMNGGDITFNFDFARA